MSIEKIVRAWRDRAYREGLSQEELAELPASPIGEALDEHELSRILGGIGTMTGPGPHPQPQPQPTPTATCGFSRCPI